MKVQEASRIRPRRAQATRADAQFRVWRCAWRWQEKNLSARKMEATLEMLRSPFSPRLLGHGLLLGDIRGRGVAGLGAVRFAGRNDLPELRQVVVEVVEDPLALGRTRACDVLLYEAPELGRPGVRDHALHADNLRVDLFREVAFLVQEVTLLTTQLIPRGLTPE